MFETIATTFGLEEKLVEIEGRLDNIVDVLSETATTIKDELEVCIVKLKD